MNCNFYGRLVPFLSVAMLAALATGPVEAQTFSAPSFGPQLRKLLVGLDMLHGPDPQQLRHPRRGDQPARSVPCWIRGHDGPEGNQKLLHRGCHSCSRV